MYEYDSDPWTWREYLEFFMWVLLPTAIVVVYALLRMRQ